MSIDRKILVDFLSTRASRLSRGLNIYVSILSYLSAKKASMLVRYRTGVMEIGIYRRERVKSKRRISPKDSKSN